MCWQNGFKCHCMSESHQRQLLLASENPHKFMDYFSKWVPLMRSLCLKRSISDLAHMLDFFFFCQWIQRRLLGAAQKTFRWVLTQMIQMFVLLQLTVSLHHPQGPSESTTTSSTTNTSATGSTSTWTPPSGRLSRTSPSGWAEKVSSRFQTHHHNHLQWADSRDTPQLFSFIYY